MSSVLDVLYDCQKKMGTGYLSAFPSEFFDRAEALTTVWAPYYTIHKVYNLLLLLEQHGIIVLSCALDSVIHIPCSILLFCVIL